MKRKILFIFVKLIIVEMFFLVLFWWIFGLARVQSNSMAPNINGGDLAFFYHLDKNYRIGDAVTLVRDGKRYFLRVAAVGGDTIDIKGDDVYVNGVPLDSDKETMGHFGENRTVFPFHVSDDELFLIGDNHDEGGDSREFGAVKKSEIDGKILSILRTRGL